MKTIPIITIIILFLGCCKSNTMKMDEIISIKIAPNQREHLEDAVEITEADLIKEISLILGNARKEPLKFLADYKIELNSKDSTTILLVRNNLINNQGITYRTSKDLGKKLEEIIKARQ